MSVVYPWLAVNPEVEAPAVERLNLAATVLLSGLGFVVFLLPSRRWCSEPRPGRGRRSRSGGFATAVLLPMALYVAQQVIVRLL